MTKPSPIDIDASHRHFSAGCFNQAWTLLDKADRSEEEDRLMVATAFASLYHWLQRPDFNAQHLSVGYWQISRVHSVLGRGAEALHYAEICESCSQLLPPFYRGYALEAVARAAALLGHADRATLAQITDPAERSVLEADL